MKYLKTHTFKNFIKIPKKKKKNPLFHHVIKHQNKCFLYTFAEIIP